MRKQIPALPSIEAGAQTSLTCRRPVFVSLNFRFVALVANQAIVAGDGGWRHAAQCESAPHLPVKVEMPPLQVDGFRHHQPGQHASSGSRQHR